MTQKRAFFGNPKRFARHCSDGVQSLPCERAACAGLQGSRAQSKIFINAQLYAAAGACASTRHDRLQRALNWNVVFY